VHVQLDDALTVSAGRDADVLALDDALKTLEAEDPMQAQIVQMRFFGGMSVQAVADALGVPKRRVEREWTLIKAWLRRELAG
jgi:ECF sigma factor.